MESVPCHKKYDTADRAVNNNRKKFLLFGAYILLVKKDCKDK